MVTSNGPFVEYPRIQTSAQNNGILEIDMPQSSTIFLKDCSMSCIRGKAQDVATQKIFLQASPIISYRSLSPMSFVAQSTSGAAHSLFIPKAKARSWYFNGNDKFIFGLKLPGMEKDQNPLMAVEGNGQFVLSSRVITVDLEEGQEIVVSSKKLMATNATIVPCESKLDESYLSRLRNRLSGMLPASLTLWIAVPKIAQKDPKESKSPHDRKTNQKPGISSSERIRLLSQFKLKGPGTVVFNIL